MSETLTCRECDQAKARDGRGGWHPLLEALGLNGYVCGDCCNAHRKRDRELSRKMFEQRLKA